MCKIVKEKMLITYCKEKSTIDDNIYNVQCQYKDKKRAANMLYKLNNKANRLIDYLYSKYGSDKSDRGSLSRNLQKRYKGRHRLVETDPDNKEGDTSFVFDKGDLMSLCIRCSKDKTKTCFHQENDLMFVTIHELAHVAANVDQHPYRFWRIFKWLLKEAIETKDIYYKQDYDTNPVIYCDTLEINYQPLNDGNLRDISATEYYTPIPEEDNEPGQNNSSGGIFDLSWLTG